MGYGNNVNSANWIQIKYHVISVVLEAYMEANGSWGNNKQTWMTWHNRSVIMWLGGWLGTFINHRSTERQHHSNGGISWVRSRFTHFVFYKQQRQQKQTKSLEFLVIRERKEFLENEEYNIIGHNYRSGPGGFLGYFSPRWVGSLQGKFFCC